MNAPWNSGLPIALTVGGKEYEIRSDYRAVLDIFLALSDAELDDYNKTMEVIEIMYVDEIPNELVEEALDRAFWFIRGGESERKQSGPQLVSWSQDFNLIAAPISKIIGQDIRGMDYLHWWTFLAAYMGIGECLFADVVRIRSKKARGKSLDKSDREFYRKNQDIIDIKKPLTEAEEQIISDWM